MAVVSFLTGWFKVCRSKTLSIKLESDTSNAYNHFSFWYQELVQKQWLISLLPINTNTAVTVIKVVLLFNVQLEAVKTSFSMWWRSAHLRRKTWHDKLLYQQEIKHFYLSFVYMKLYNNSQKTPQSESLHKVKQNCKTPRQKWRYTQQI